MFFELGYNVLNITSHCRYAIRTNAKNLGSPGWTDNIKDARNKVVYIVCSVSFKHRNCKDVYVEYIVIAMDSNTIVKI